jgi:hypothetical protein
VTTYKVVYGNIDPPVRVATGLSKEDADEYAERMNVQAPQYNHRAEEES